jgi:hypothetical protein
MRSLILGLASRSSSQLFQSQLPDGYIAHMTNDNHDSMTPHSQSPVFGFVADIVSTATETSPRELFVQQMYESGASYISWWTGIGTGNSTDFTNS